MINWEQEQRQAPIGIILFLLQIVRAIFKMFWPLILVFVFKGKSDKAGDAFYYVILALVLLLLIASVFAYRFFKFQIINNELVVKKGFLRKLRIAVPLERIQTINIKQNVIQNWLNLVSLEVDTAGSKGNEIRFIALKKEVATELEDILSKYKAEQKAYSEFEPLHASNGHTPILSLNFTDLIKVGTSENHLRSFLIILGFVYGIYNQIRDVFEEQVNQLSEESLSYAQNLALSSVVVLGVFAFIVSVLFSFVRTILVFYNLKMSQQESTIKIQYGLLSTRVWNIPLSKVQLISFHHNPIRRWMKFSTLKIKQAVSGASVGKNQTIWVPSCSKKAFQTLKQMVLEPNHADFSEKIKPHTRYFILRFIWLSIPLLIGAFSFYQHWQAWLFFVASEIVLLVFFLLMRQKRYARISDNNLFVSKGSVSQSEYFLSLHKIQAVQLKQSIFQRRRALCTLVLYTASGTTLRLPYLSEELGRQLQNYCLYKVQTSHKSWM